MTEHATIHEAMLAAQQAFPAIVFNKQGQARGGRYAYADLGEITSKILPVLHEHGLYLLQRFEVGPLGQAVLVTEVYHAQSGESLRSDLPMPPWGDASWQDMGSGMTYFKRYGLAAFFVLVADEDDDAQGATDAVRTPPPVQRPQGVAPLPSRAPAASAPRPAPRSGELSDAQVGALMNLASKAGDSVGVHGFDMVNHSLKRLGYETVKVGSKRPAYLEALKQHSPNFDDFQQAIRDEVKRLMGDEPQPGPARDDSVPL